MRVVSIFAVVIILATALTFAGNKNSGPMGSGGETMGVGDQAMQMQKPSIMEQEQNTGETDKIQNQNMLQSGDASQTGEMKQAMEQIQEQKQEMKQEQKQEMKQEQKQTKKQKKLQKKLKTMEAKKEQLQEKMDSGEGSYTKLQNQVMKLDGQINQIQEQLETGTEEKAGDELTPEQKKMGVDLIE